jgi:hypothetical protein
MASHNSSNVFAILISLSLLCRLNGTNEVPELGVILLQIKSKVIIVLV